MALFQAILLAASLGWTTVLAEPLSSAEPNATYSNAPPYNSKSLTNLIPPTPKTLFPHLMSSAYSLEPDQAYPTSGSMTVESPVTAYTDSSLSAPHYAAPVTLITGASLERPGPSPGKPTGGAGKATAIPEHHVSNSPGSPGAAPGDSNHEGGGAGGAPDATAAPTEQTYYIHGSPVVAGASATVIAGTTYSLAPSGGEIWADGKKTSAAAVASTWPSGSASHGVVPATGGSCMLAAPGMFLAMVGGLVCLL